MTARPRIVPPGTRPATLLLATASGLGIPALVLLATHHGGALRIALPVFAPLAAVWIYTRAGFPAYLAFAWCFWMFVPGLRRVVDFQEGAFDPRNPLSLVPFLVSAVAVIPILRRAADLQRRRFWIWCGATACIVYGYIVGLPANGLLAASHALMSWVVPLVVGLAIAIEWRQYPACCDWIGRSVVPAAALVSIYGVIQFVDPSPWDRLWVLSSGMHSIGTPLPYRLRVFSLMNSPFSFAILLLAGIFIALASRGATRIVALVLSAMALSLTLVRSVWLAAALGIVLYVAGLPGPALRRTVFAVAAAVALMAGIVTQLPRGAGSATTQLVRDRLLTLGNLHEDVSFSERTLLVERAGRAVLASPLGHGLGSTDVSAGISESDDAIKDFDSGIFAVLYALGWIAGTAYIGIAGYLAYAALARGSPDADQAAKAARAIVVATFALSIGGNVFEGLAGLIFWSSAGLVAAGRRWNTADAFARRAQAAEN